MSNGTQDKQDALKTEFKNKLIRQNSKRFVTMLGIGALSQIILTILELVGLLEFKLSSLYIKVGIILMCAVFALLLTRIRKSTEKSQDIKMLAFIKTTLHFAILIIGFASTIYMYSQEMYTFSSFIIAALMISITHIRWPYFTNGLLVVGFVLLTSYLQFTFTVPVYFRDETHIVVLLLVLIGIVNILNYKRHWELFIKENQIHEMNQKLVEISQVDELTGLFNRRKVLEELENYIALAKKYSNDFCVVMIDLDNFKRVNDKYGHIEGDNTLRNFSGIVKSNLRKNDIFGRWGGEEFIIIIPDSKKDDAFSFVDRIRETIANYDFKKIGKLTFSAGICEFVPEYTDDKLIGNADFALYLSKQLGRNQVKVFSQV